MVIISVFIWKRTEWDTAELFKWGIFLVWLFQPARPHNFSFTIQSHNCSKTGDAIKIAEEQGCSHIDTKILHGSERAGDSRIESKDIGDGGDCNGHCHLWVRIGESFAYALREAGLLPGRNHDKHVINSNTTDMATENTPKTATHILFLIQSNLSSQFWRSNRMMQHLCKGFFHCVITWYLSLWWECLREKKQKEI